MHILRERGYRALNRIIPSDITQVLTLVLNNALNTETVDDAYQFAYLSAADVVAFSQDPKTELKSDMASLIEGGQARCYAITHGEDLAGYTWIATGRVAPEHNCGGSQFLGIGLELPEPVAYIFKVLVLPNHRGKRLNGRMLSSLADHVRHQGIQSFITTTDWTNYAFLSSAQSIGFKQIALAGEFILGSKHFYKLPSTGIPGLSLFGGGQAD